MRAVLTIIAVIAVLAAGTLAAAIAFSAPNPPPPMKSVSTSFDGADMSGLPPKQHYTARDGTALVYRAYPGDPNRIVVVIHGSSGTTASMHLVAHAIHAKGATVYALAMRGHDGTGRSGDVDYIGQLEDDVVDFVKTLGPHAKGQSRTLLGFSSGGGFALRFAGGTNNGLFDRLILVSPQFPHDAPTARTNAGGWVSIAIPRLVGLNVLNAMGITSFNDLPALAMAVDPARLAASGQTPVYTYRMLTNFGPSTDYLGEVKRVKGPVFLFVGAEDEIFHADQFAPLLKPVRPDIHLTVVPGINHMGMTVKPAALEAIAAAAD